MTKLNVLLSGLRPAEVGETVLRPMTELLIQSCFTSCPTAQRYWAGHCWGSERVPAFPKIQERKAECRHPCRLRNTPCSLWEGYWVGWDQLGLALAPLQNLAALEGEGFSGFEGGLGTELRSRCRQGCKALE